MLKSQKYAMFFSLGALVVGSVFLLTKLFRPRRKIGFAEKTGQNIDSSIKNVAEYLDKATTTLQGAAETGTVKSVGRSIDDAFSEALSALNRVKIAVKGVGGK